MPLTDKVKPVLLPTGDYNCKDLYSKQRKLIKWFLHTPVIQSFYLGICLVLVLADTTELAISSRSFFSLINDAAVFICETYLREQCMEAKTPGHPRKTIKEISW